MMITYRKTITLDQSQSGEYTIKTDRGSRYQAFAIANSQTPWSTWWEMQNQSDLRLWQKDIMRDFGTRWNDLTPFVIYKKNAGHSQPHDMALANSASKNIWIFSTERDFWIIPSQFGNFDFSVEDSMGSILDVTTRKEIYKVIDTLGFMQ